MSLVEDKEETNDELYEPLGNIGTATIVVRFENRVQWQKWRKYILHTDWEFDAGIHPYTASIEKTFKTVADVEGIAKTIVDLLQMDFDVYSCNWQISKATDKN